MLSAFQTKLDKAPVAMSLLPGAAYFLLVALVSGKKRPSCVGLGISRNKIRQKPEPYLFCLMLMPDV